MALLQISEPGQSPNPHQKQIAIGIDLGTTHSLVAAIRNSVAECLPDENGQTLLPSAIQYLKNSRKIGWAAIEDKTDEANKITSVKRLMGQKLEDIQNASALPYKIADTKNQEGMVEIQTIQGIKTPVEISAEILATLRQRAEDTFDEEIQGAVITVPAYFDDAQRQATKDAAKLAGINVLRLLNEPTAAALAYGLDNNSQGTYAVYDLGGGTFDISILKLENGIFEVIATGGDSKLGGDDYDINLAAYLSEMARCKQTNCHQCESDKEKQSTSPQEKAYLLQSAKQIKEQLSQQEQTNWTCPHGSQLTITQEKFKELTKNLTDRTIALIKQTLKDANLSPQDIQGTIMVGGATRMPQIRKAVEDLFQTPPLTNLNPDEVVAQGAAIQANQLIGGSQTNPDLLLLDVIPLSLGIETMGGMVERIIPRNQTIPVTMAQDFTTYQDGQTAMSLHIVQGERDMVQDCRSLAKFELRGIPPMTAGAARIRVTYTVDANGLLQVSAKEQTSGIQAQINVKPSYGLTDEQITKMLQDSYQTAQEDIKTRALAQAKLDADRLITAVQSALKADSHLLSQEEQTKINEHIKDLENQKQNPDTTPAQIEEKANKLANATESFAAARMNASIQKALSGKTIDTI